MARALELRVVAEGIEEEAQHDVLRGEGIEYYQGFLRSVPLGQEDFLKLARAR
jgi:sensor c-di-GMP phosphodiesterase-like protein